MASFTPVILNVVLIAFAVWVEPLSPRPGVGLAAGVFAAGLVQLAFQVPFLARLGLLPRPRWDAAHEGVRRIFRLMGPAMIGSSVAQISILLDTLVASLLIAGSIPWLYYSDRLIEFPLGVLGVALATVILPRLAEQHASGAPERFAATLDWALRLVLVIALPAAVGIALLAEPLLATLFHYGEFTERDVVMSAASVRAYAPGLVGFILVKVLAPGYFARQDTRTPVRIGIQALTLSMVLNVAFVVLLVQTGWAPAHAGIAAATACSGLFNAAFLLSGLSKTKVYTARPGWRRLWMQALAGNVAMAVALLVAQDAIGDWFALGKVERTVCARAVRRRWRCRISRGLLAARAAPACVAHARRRALTRCAYTATCPRCTGRERPHRASSRSACSTACTSVTRRSSRMRRPSPRRATTDRSCFRSSRHRRSSSRRPIRRRASRASASGSSGSTRFK